MHETRAETVWKSEMYAVKRETEGLSAGKLFVVDKDTGFTDWPIMYSKSEVDTGRVDIGWDKPERWPHYVKCAVRVIYQDDFPLYKKFKLQLASMLAFMSETEGLEYNFTGEMPGYPSQYFPYGYNEENEPVHKVWEAFLEELLKEGMMDRLEKANEMDFDTLLNESEYPIPF